MSNINLLKSKMILLGDESFIQCIANLLEISRTTASKKINGELPFTDIEITAIAKRYNLSAEDIKNIFIGD